MREVGRERKGEGMDRTECVVDMRPYQTQGLNSGKLSRTAIFALSVVQDTPLKKEREHVTPRPAGTKK